ncbi:MAG: hypothetical protein J2P49_07750 [Methylocapsa sp.]|nr:hypothetical protein [Methylocapsa sp.]
MGIIERLDCLLDRENAILREHRLADLEEHNQKKSLGLLEMRRAIAAVRGCGCETLGLETKPAVARLREKLQSNLSLLRTHLEAIAAITAAIARTIEQQESDGTYLPGHVSKASRS